MVINDNNTYINSFTKGMNSDGSYDQLDNAQYVHAKNVRITKNQAVGESSSAAKHEGIIAPVLTGIVASSTGDGFTDSRTILAVDTVDNLCTVVATTGKDLEVWRIDIDEINNTASIKTGSYIWRAENVYSTAPKLVSTVLYKELENVIKLYIADTVHPTIVLRVDDDNLSSSTYNKDKNIDDLINDRIIPQRRVFVKDVITGRLPAGQVLYTYRYYNKYANATQLAPLTNKILVIDASRAKEKGNAEGTETSIGFQLRINVDDFAARFERLQVFRLAYTKPHLDAAVDLIYDGKIKTNADGYFVLNDVGADPVSTMTMEEFSAMSGIILTPQVVENNQDYMFCANVQDETIIRGVQLKNSPEIELAYANVALTEKCDGAIPTPPTARFGEHFGQYKVYFGDTLEAAWSDEYITWGTGTNHYQIDDYFAQHGVDPTITKSTYNNIFTSSLLRSLRRGEEYKYGVVFYDKNGRRSDVISLQTSSGSDVVSVPEDAENLPPFYVGKTTDGQDVLMANPIGIKMNVPQPCDANGDLLNDIVGCQIVRRSSSDLYQNTILQVALARPLSQGLALLTDDTTSTNRSPYYPSGFLSVVDMTILPHYYLGWTDTEVFSETFTIADGTEKYLAYTEDEKKLFLIFSSEIDFARDDVLEKIEQSGVKMHELLYLPETHKRLGTVQYESDKLNTDLYFFGQLKTEDEPYIANQATDFSEFSYGFNADGTPNMLNTSERIILGKKYAYRMSANDKSSVHFVFDFFKPSKGKFTSETEEVEIKSAKDVKIAGWNDGFTEVTRVSSDSLAIYDAIKKYKSFTTSIDQYVFNNWVSWGKYDFKVGTATYANQNYDSSVAAEMIGTQDPYTTWMTYQIWNPDSSEWGFDGKLWINKNEFWVRNGYVGPGGSSLLICTKDSFGSFPANNSKMHTSICNITHTRKIEDVEGDEFTRYFGFGNYFPLKMSGGSYVAVEEANSSGGNDTLRNFIVVFDGDIYITPHELTTMYKTYNFESADTLQSTQITNYVPLESKVNTYFDYGMNLLNTESANLIYEPGQIEGIVTQERPVHQYNMIYSANDESNDMFTLISTDINETNQFKQRTYYSEPKINGEFIDNYLIFKAAAFIDVDSKYGQITELMSDKNQLYYWQDHAFGKFSVNERSLINDQNGNTIMLGQAGILSRYDYISTKYGMRLYDFCAASAENGVYWVDINNKAVVGGNGNSAVNYGEQVNVLNVLNRHISSDVPYVDYDVQNNELLCKCLAGGEQLIFNTKYGIATSIYTRNYIDIANVKNHLYTLQFDSSKLKLTKINYIDQNVDYLAPMSVEFVVNPGASVTKVFDNLSVIPIDRAAYNSVLFANNKVSFETDLYEKKEYKMSNAYNDREGNITYAIPRFDGLEYGNRMRGKWLKVDINVPNPTMHTTISHVLTKYRQSFS